MERQMGLGEMFKRVDGLLEKRANASLAEDGVTLSQMSVLVFLDGEPQKRAEFKDLERALGVSQPTVAGLVSRLRGKGLVDVGASEERVNGKVASLTADGRRVCARAARKMDAEEEQMLAGFSERERGELLGLLGRVADNLREG